LNKILFIVSLLLCTGLLAQKSIPKPSPARLIVDNANVLADYDEQQLTQKLIALDDSTSNQIVIITVPSLNNEVIEDVAVNTFRQWGIGNKKTNNGILILVAVNDRKIRIEVGLGLEGAIPDITTKEIINNSIKPAFKQGNFYGGLHAAVNDLSKAASGEYHTKRSKKSNNQGDSFIFFGLIIFIIILLIIKNKRGGGGNYRRAGLADFIAPIFFNSGGWSSGGGNSNDGGGFDFGGFGGGSSGGGGASDSW
jgi:uncharacterized protein